MQLPYGKDQETGGTLNRAPAAMREPDGVLDQRHHLIVYKGRNALSSRKTGQSISTTRDLFVLSGSGFSVGTNTYK